MYSAHNTKPKDINVLVHKEQMNDLLKICSGTERKAICMRTGKEDGHDALR
jgi:hypothetical protein